MSWHETRLANGLAVVAELDPLVHSAAVGFFVRTGSRDETADVSGVSHFLEHMAFKGNDRYSAEDVNRVFDEIGARYNASTSEETTMYYAAVLPEHLPRTFDLLSALIRPSLRQADFDVEKQVILEEIAMYDDRPSFLCYEKGMEAHFAGHPLGRSILGSIESITALRAEQMRQYHAEKYGAGNVTLAVAGNVAWPDVLSLAEAHCGGWPAGRHERPRREARPPGGTFVTTRDETQQMAVMQMAPAPPSDASERMRFAAEIVSVIVGDDSGSRMYWELVDPGCVESAEIGYNDYDDCGTWLTFVGGDPESIVENLERVRGIYRDVNRDGVTETELQRAKNKVAARIVLRGERPMGRLSSIGGNWLTRGEYRSVDDDLRNVEAVTRTDVAELLAAYPLRQTTTVAIGPLESLDFAPD